MPDSRLCSHSPDPEIAWRNWNWKLLQTHNLPERVFGIYDHIMWKWVKRRMLFSLEPLSSPCHSSNSLPLWPRVSMELPNNSRCSIGTWWNQTNAHGSSVRLALCECVSCCRSISLRSARSENWHKNHIFISFEMFAFKDVSHRWEKKWLVFRLDMYLEIFFPHLVDNSYSDRWGEVFIFRIYNYQCVFYFLITN